MSGTTHKYQILQKLSPLRELFASQLLDRPHSDPGSLKLAATTHRDRIRRYSLYYTHSPQSLMVAFEIDLPRPSALHASDDPFQITHAIEAVPPSA